MKVFATCIALLALSGVAYGIQCFVCNSKLDSACQDEFNYDSPALKGAFIEECNNVTGAFCRKSKIYLSAVKEVPSGEVRVLRECAYQRREVYDCYQKRSEDYYIDVCQCDEDLCNSSPVLSLSLAPALAITLPFFAKFL